jgi:hypothetical protein
MIFAALVSFEVAMACTFRSWSVRLLGHLVFAGSDVRTEACCACIPLGFCRLVLRLARSPVLAFLFAAILLEPAFRTFRTPSLSLPYEALLTVGFLIYVAVIALAAFAMSIANLLAQALTVKPACLTEDSCNQ